MNFGYSSSFQALDKGLIEKVGPTGFTVSIFNLSSNFIGYNSGFIYNAIFIILCFSFIFFMSFAFFYFGFFTFFNLQFLLILFSFLVISLFNIEL